MPHGWSDSNVTNTPSTSSADAPVADEGDDTCAVLAAPPSQADGRNAMAISPISLLRAREVSARLGNNRSLSAKHYRNQRS